MKFSHVYRKITCIGIFMFVCRPDHNLQDIRAKVFPFKRRKVNAPEIMPSIALPAKRKERSLSSLVVSTPKVPIQNGLTGRRSKAGARKAAALRGCNFTVEESKKEDSAEDNPMSPSSPGSPVKSIQKRRLVKETLVSFLCLDELKFHLDVV
jgi:E3 ubiquitin-protein ligase DRIP